MLSSSVGRMQGFQAVVVGSSLKLVEVDLHWMKVQVKQGKLDTWEVSVD